MVNKLRHQNTIEGSKIKNILDKSLYTLGDSWKNAILNELELRGIVLDDGSPSYPTEKVKAAFNGLFGKEAARTLLEKVETGTT